MLSLRNALFVAASLLVGAVALMGCAGQSASPPTGGSQSTDAWKTGLDEDVVTALSQLSTAERAAVLAQEICPVTDKPLGSMGKPPKVTVEGQTVYLCCAGCEEQIKSNPADYLAKVKKPD